MADFNKLGGLPGLGYGPSTLDQEPVVRSSHPGQLYEDVANAAEQVGQVFRERSKEEAQVAGEKAVTRDADGNIQVAQRQDGGLLERMFLPENTKIYENAAAARWLNETSIDIDKALTKAHLDHALDPQGFDAAVSGIRQSFLGNIPSQLGDPGLIAPHLDEAISRIAQQHSKSILETKFNADTAASKNSIDAKIKLNTNDMGNLVRAHATDTDEYRRLEGETINLYRTKAGNPAFGYTQEQADLDITALQSDLRVEATLGHLEDIVKSEGVDKGKEWLKSQEGKGNELGLNPDDLDKVLTRGKTYLTGVETETNKAKAEFQDKNFTDLDLMAEQGRLPLSQIQKARASGAISEAQTRSLQDKVITKAKDNSELSDAIGRVFKLPMDPSNTTDRKATDQVFDALVQRGADPLGIAIRMAQTSGILPGKVVSRLRGASVSNDPNFVSQGLDMGRQIIEAVPDAFDKMPGGDSMARDAEQFRHLTRDMAMPDQEAAARIIAQRDPAVRRRNEEIVDSFKKQVSDIKANDMLTSMNLRGFWSRIFGGPTAGLTDGQSAQALADYKSFVTERLKETGDLESAKAVAAQDMRKLYGVTNVGGSPTLTKFPPEGRYPKVMGSWDYIRQQAAEDASAALGSPKRSEGVGVGGLLPGGKGNLDPKKAGDNWTTVQLTEDGIEKHYILPTLPGDKPPSGDGIELGDAVKRFLKTKQHYGAFDTDADGARFMQNGGVLKDGPKIRPEDVQIVPSTQTAQDWAKGVPPRYTVMVKQGNTWVALPSGYWRPDPAKAGATAATEFQTRRAKAATELNPVINQPNVVPGL